MLYVDSKTWLPDDLLIKADKITMANSLELRVPLLDHKVLEFAASLSPDFKVRGSETKRVLKAAFSHVLPSEVLSRKKAGFPVPYGSWLRNELRARTEEVLLSPDASVTRYLPPPALRGILDENARDGSRSREVFCLLVLELLHRSDLFRSPSEFGWVSESRVVSTDGSSPSVVTGGQTVPASAVLSS